MTGKLPPEVYDSEDFKAIYTKLESFFKTKENNTEVPSCHPGDCSEPVQQTIDRTNRISASSPNAQLEGMTDAQQSSESSSRMEKGQTVRNEEQSSESNSGTQKGQTRNEGPRQLIEQFEPGVYVTLVQLSDGTKMFKRVRFSKRKFNEQQAEVWWRENSSRVLRKYNKLGADGSEIGSSVTSASSSSAVDEPQASS